VPLSGCVHFCEAGVVPADDAILVSLEGSSPEETHIEGAHNGGIDVVGRTGRVWKKKTVGAHIIQTKEIRYFQITSFWQLRCDNICVGAYCNGCPCGNTTLVPVVLF